jgi:predicted nuclease with RNAse H fold
VTHWAGVDVGGARKGFHVAVIDEQRLLYLDRSIRPGDVCRSAEGSMLVAVDAPRTCARAGESVRDSERRLVREVRCGIRWTPDEQTVRSGNPYYGWIRHGLELYDALAAGGFHAVECFPTASWTRWGGARSCEPRARWAGRVLATVELADLPTRMNQDCRDAIGAALTARAHTYGLTERLGEIVVPLRL